MKTYIFPVVILVFALSACGPSATPTPLLISTEVPTTDSLESTPIQTEVTDGMDFFSSDQLGICFSYPQGFTQMPYNDAVEIVGPSLPNTDSRGLFWLDITDAYDRTVETIVEQELTMVPGLAVDSSTVTLDGEQAIVLDGMPGQDLTRKVYAVHGQTLFILTFSPIRSQNKDAGDQMEALFSEIMDTWSWSSCSING